MFFSFAQSLTDAFLLSDMAIQFLDVKARLLRLGGGGFDVLHIRPVSEINDDDDGNRCAESEEPNVTDKTRDNSGGTRSGQIGNRRPQEIPSPR